MQVAAVVQHTLEEHQDQVVLVEVEPEPEIKTAFRAAQVVVRVITMALAEQ